MQFILYRIGDRIQYLFGDSTVLSIIVGDLDLWLEELIKESLPFEINNRHPRQLKSCLR